MYAKHFHLTDEPFGVTPDPAYVYLGAEHREALTAMQAGVVERRGIITLVGEIGTGKTTLLHTLLSRLGSDVRVVCVPYGVDTLEKLLARILMELGAGTRKTAKADLLKALHEHLVRHVDQGITVALAIDEAQNLSDETLEGLTLLSNLETYEHKLLQIILVGEPPLEERLAGARLRRLGDRVAVRARIFPLSRREARCYIEHRLVRAGASTRAVLSRGAVHAIVRGSAGVPRRINAIGHNALLYACRRDRRRVSWRIARRIVLDTRGYLQSRRQRGEEGGASVLMMFGKWAAAGLAVACVAIAAVAVATRLPYGLRIVSGADGAPEHTSTRDALVAGAIISDGGRDGTRLITATGSVCVDSSAANDASESGGATASAAADAGPPEPMPSLESPEPAVPDYHPGVTPGVAGGGAKVVAVQLPDVAEDVAATVADDAEPLRVEEDTSPEPRVVVARVRQGSTLMSLGRELYGGHRFNAGEYLAEVRRLNPELSNVDRVLPGQRVRLPAPEVRAPRTSGDGLGTPVGASTGILGVVAGRTVATRREY